MANICTFKMVLRGTEDKIVGLLRGIHCFDLRGFRDPIVAGNEITFFVMGETRWNVTTSMVAPPDGATLKELSKTFDIEVEVFGYDTSEPVWIEHYHYNKGIAIKEYNLPAWFESWELEEGEIEVDITQYTYHEDADVYSLKKEFAEQFTWDEENKDMIVAFDMLAGTNNPATTPPLANDQANDFQEDLFNEQEEQHKYRFCMTIEDIFGFGGKVIVFGRITEGCVRVGDTVSIATTDGGILSAEVVKIDNPPQKVTEAKVGDDCGIHLTGVKKTDIKRGELIFIS